MSTAWLLLIEGVTVALLVLIGQALTARSSRRSVSEVAEVDSQTAATDAWRTYAEKMEARLAALEEREAENRRRIAVLEHERDRDKDLIRRLLARLRKALAEVRRLGGTVSEADLEVIDLTLTRLNLDRPDRH